MIKEAPRKRPIRLLFQDEGRFGRISDRRRCWAPLPMRPTVGSQIVREYVYALTAVSPQDGALATLVMPWIDTDTMSVFMEFTAKQFANDFCIMFLDGAGWHRAHALRIPANVRLIGLPPYSPELNPVELVWDYLRDNYMGNQVFESLDQVMDVLEKGLHEIGKQPNMIKSMTNFDWINALSLTYN